MKTIIKIALLGTTIIFMGQNMVTGDAMDMYSSQGTTNQQYQYNPRMRQNNEQRIDMRDEQQKTWQMRNNVQNNQQRLMNQSTSQNGQRKLIRKNSQRETMQVETEENPLK